jgi:hypothetical protein
MPFQIDFHFHPLFAFVEVKHRSLLDSSRVLSRKPFETARSCQAHATAASFGEEAEEKGARQRRKLSAVGP